MLHRRTFLIAFLICCTLSVWGQKVGIKNNLLYDATTTPNLGLEWGVGKKSTIDLNVGVNPFTFDNGRKIKHWAVQPELRHWFCEKFNGGFWGFHLHGGQFNFANVNVPFGWLNQLEHNRYEGWFAGAGFSIGHQWVLSKRWNLEASIGAGYAYIDYDKYDCAKCGPKLKEGKYHYFGPTKATISLIYIIK